MNYDDLKQLGYRQQADGSWARPKPAAGTARLPYAEPKHAARETLDDAPPREAKGQGRVTVRITRFSSRLLDADNFAGGTKPLIDQLRYARLIPDDDPASVELVFRQEKAGRKQEKTVIEITQP